MSTEKTPMIFTAIADIMKDVEPIEKDRSNQGLNFKFRGIDDVYNALHPLLKKHRVFLTAKVLEIAHQDRKTARGNEQIWALVKMEYTFHTVDGSSVSTEACGEACDTSDKATSKSQSIAQRTAFLQMFVIPTETLGDSDPDAHSPQVGTRMPPRQQPQRTSAPQRSERPPAHDQRTGEVVGIDEAKQLAKIITDAENADELKLVGSAVAAAKDRLAQTVRDGLSAAYKARMAELKPKGS